MLDEILEQLAGPGNGGLAAALRDIVASPSTGGLNGLVERFAEAGLGHVAQSWVASGPNLPVSPQELRSTLGDDRLGNLAQSAGLPLPDLLAGLSRFLPAVVDRLTPQGRVPAGGWVDDGAGPARA